MNYSMIAYIIGWLLNIEAAFMILPCITGLIYRESSVKAFLITMGVCLLIGLPLTRKKPENKTFFTRDGFITVALCWIIMSIMGGLPFLFSGVITNPVDALFETVSGFTTTGASILTEVETVPKSILFWRSFTHWIGGMGLSSFSLPYFP